jgi:hypothetical protein
MQLLQEQVVESAQQQRDCSQKMVITLSRLLAVKIG